MVVNGGGGLICTWIFINFDGVAQSQTELMRHLEVLLDSQLLLEDQVAIMPLVNCVVRQYSPS